MMSKTRQEIIKDINNLIGFRLGNLQRGTGSLADQTLIAETLGFRSLCLFSGLDDKQLKKLWEESNLRFSL